MKVKIGTTMDPELYRLVQETAQARGCSISQLIGVRDLVTAIGSSSECHKYAHGLSMT